MACTWTYTDPLTGKTTTFKDEDELNSYIETNKASIVEAYNQAKTKNQIVGAKGAENNRELARSLNYARELEKQGKSKEEIFKATKWERGAEGKWKTTLPTDNIKIVNNVIKTIRDTNKFSGVTLDKILDYPELYALYPALKNIKVDISSSTDKASGAVIATGQGRLFIKLHPRLEEVQKTDNERVQDTIIHEVQHVVQALEDFYFSPKNDKSFEDYFNSYSEIEARNAAKMSLIADEEKHGLTISFFDTVLPEDKAPSLLYSKDFKGTVVFNKDNNLDKTLLNRINRAKNPFPEEGNNDKIMTGYGFNWNTGEINKDNLFYYLYSGNINTADRINKLGEIVKHLQDINPELKRVDKLLNAAAKNGSWSYRVALMDVIGGVASNFHINDIVHFLKNGNDSGFEKDIAQQKFAERNPEYVKAREALDKLHQDWGNEKNLDKRLTPEQDQLINQLGYVLSPETTKRVIKGEPYPESVASYKREGLQDRILFQNGESSNPIHKRILDTLEAVDKTKLINDIDAIFKKETGLTYDAWDKKTLDEEDENPELNGLAILRGYVKEDEPIIDGVVDVIKNGDQKSKTELVKLLKNYGVTNSDIEVLNNEIENSGGYFRQAPESSLGMGRTLLNQDAKGAYDTYQKVIYAVTDPNVSTPLHELAHAWESQLNNTERKTTLDWSGQKEWTKETSENFAKGFEQYLLEGKTKDVRMQNIFERFAKWLTDVYHKVVQGLGLELSDPMRAIYDKMLNIKEEQLAKPTDLLPTQEEILNKPYKGTEPDFGRTSAVQKALSTDYYDKQITEGKLDEPTLRQILKSNGLSEASADTVMFRLNNKDLANTLKKDIPTEKYNKEYIQKLTKAYKDGTLDQAATSHNIDWRKYYDILSYIGKPTPETTEQKVHEFVTKFYKHNEPTTVEAPIEHLEPIPAVENTTAPLPFVELASQPELATETTPLEDITTSGGKTDTLEPATNVTTEEIQPNDTVVYEGKSYKDLSGRQLQVESIEDGFAKLKGIEKEVLLSTLRKATPEELQAEAQKRATEPTDVHILNGNGTTNQQDTPTKFHQDDKITFQGEEYTVEYSEQGIDIDKNGKEITTTIYTATKGAKTIRIAEDKITAAKPSAVKQAAKNHTLTIISNRFKQIFPQVETEIDAFDFDAPARFYHGRVQINTNYQGVGVDKEGIAHEYMHPLVAALKQANKYLYENLVKELHLTKKDILAEIDAKIAKGDYTKEDRTDEALVTYLGREISKAFDEQGIPRDYNEDSVVAARKELAQMDADRKKGLPVDQHLYDATRQEAERQPFIQEQRAKLSFVEKFMKWWADVMDYVLGKKKIRKIEDFVQAANSYGTNAKEEITNFIKDDKGLFYQYKKAEYHDDRKVYETELVDGKPKFKKDQEGNKIPVLDATGKQKTFRDIFEETNGTPKQNFEFAARSNQDYGVEFEKDGKTMKVFIDKDLFQDMTSTEVMAEYANRMSEHFEDNDEFQQYKDEFLDLLQTHRLTTFTKAQEGQHQTLSAAGLHPRMGLDGLVTLMQANLGKDAITPFEYTPDQLATIQQMENYLKVDDETAEKLASTRSQIVKKIKALGDIATRRIAEGTSFTKLSEDAEYLSKHNTFTPDDGEFILDYVHYGASSINTAYRVFNYVKEQLADKDTLDQPKLNRLNKEIEQIKQLVGMYDDSTQYGLGLRSLFNRYKESIDEEEWTNFDRSTARLDMLKDNMKQTLAELGVEQLWPTIERNNKSLQKQGYEKYVVDRDKLKSLLLNGSNQDIGWFAFMLGAPVNSTDTVNAAIANSISDALNYVYSNNLDSINQIVDAHLDFIKRVGNDLPAQEKYYKENYLRDAEFWDVISRDKDGKPTYGYIKKKAFHQDKLYDKFENDLRLYKESLPEAKTHLDDLANQKLANQWVADHKDDAKYINKDYNRLKTDKYYQALYDNYATYNNKYGENRLNYGIIPQFYHETFMQKFREKLQNVKGIGTKDKTLGERATLLADEVFGQQLGKKDTRALNLDGTIYRTVNSETTTLKDDTKLDYNLHKIMYDFISDAGNYEAKREVQFNIENIKQLIAGNDFFGIKERTVGTRDFATEFRLKRVAKEELKRLDKEIAGGKVLTADEQTQYNKYKEDAAGNTFKFVYDKFLGRQIAARTNRANRQAEEFINDVFYGEDEYASHLKVGGRVFDLNKFGKNVGLIQAVVNMSGNIVAGTNNVLAGNVQSFIEAYGGKHFTLKDLAKAHAQYTTALLKADFLGDMKNPIKSEITQYGLLFDAIQGEFTNNLGEKISGNLIHKFVNRSSLFLLTHAGEHQIQLTAMLALMNATKVDITGGGKISLKDAFVKDVNGRYKLRADAVFDKEIKQQFVRTLHGISRTLNGNYNSLHKGHLQRYWGGKLLMQYRKYLYPAVIARYGQERVDLEKGTVEAGYLRYFVGNYLISNLVKGQFNLIKKYKEMTPDQKYMARKAMAELGTYATLVTAAIAMGATNPDKMKNMSQAEKALLLFTLRMKNELGMYHVDAPAEFLQQSKNPIASMRFATSIAKIAAQMYNPTEVYKANGSGYKEGDSKMWHNMKQALPKLFTVWGDGINWDNYLSNFKLVQSLPR